jgi:Tol biopolymer transport system component/tRNA A-37 threonylcarbamoyl transferase component Bud32
MSELETLTAALADRYAIEREIGAGGMATVYLARDLKHERRVALKVLKPELGAVLGVERFLSEIKVTANLQHPNQLPLLDSGEANGLLFYVMPFVEGETLRARLEREKQLPVDEAVRFAVAIAGALEYAHQQGVYHRDLKPENILLQAGQPVVADFGIALAVTNAGGQRVTQTGLSLGTPQYMSPEQATGDRNVDGRTDIYSLGAMTYEMLTGEPPHSGNTAQAIIAKLMTEEVRPLTVLRRNVPPYVDAAVRHALEKLPADRFATAGGFALALQGKGDSSALGRYSTTGAMANAVPALRRLRIQAIAASALAVLAIAGLAWALTRPRPSIDAPVVRMTLDLPIGERVMVGGFPIAVSPRGDQLVYVTQGTSGYHTVMRGTNELVGHEIAAKSLYDLTFSPDGRWIVYRDGDDIQKMPVAGGTPVKVGPAVGHATGSNLGLGMAWLTSDTIIVGSSTGLFAIAARGGTPRRLSAASATATEEAHPVLLDGGNTVAFTKAQSADQRHLAVVSLDSRKTVELDIQAASPLGMIDGHLLYVTAAGALMAVPFDLKRLRATGDAVQVEGAVEGAGLSASGTLAYMPNKIASRLVFADNVSGDAALPISPGDYNAPRLSPDGRRVAVIVRGAISNDVWVYDIAATTFTRLTSEGVNSAPEWSPDGTRIYFKSVRGGKTSIWSQPADAGAKAELLYQPDEEVNEAIISPDAKWLLYRTAPGVVHPRNIFGVLLAGDRRPVELVTGPSQVTHPRLSPDGKWLAYQSDESGRFEVYVRPFPNPGPRVQVSNQGGLEPLWARAGRSIFYRTPNGIVSVAVTPGADIVIGERRTVLSGDYINDPTHQNYDVSLDGLRFLLLKPTGGESKAIVVHNWGRELREKLAERKQ